MKLILYQDGDKVQAESVGGCYIGFLWHADAIIHHCKLNGIFRS